MPARQLLEVLGVMKMRAVLNKNCQTGEITLPADLLRDLASGAALEPLGTGEEMVLGKLGIILPEDYPTDLLQPLFEILRRHREFRAAWIFRDEREQEPRADFQLLVYMDLRDAEIFHDLNMTLSTAATAARRVVGIGFVPEDEPAYIAQIFHAVQPFFVAADFGGTATV